MRRSQGSTPGATLPVAKTMEKTTPGASFYDAPQDLVDYSCLSLFRFLYELRPVLSGYNEEGPSKLAHEDGQSKTGYSDSESSSKRVDEGRKSDDESGKANSGWGWRPCLIVTLLLLLLVRVLLRNCVF